MKRILVVVLSVLVSLLGSTAMAAPGGATMLGATLQTMLAQTVDVTVVHTGTGTGTTVPTEGVHPLIPDDPITLSATPDPGSFFGGWVVDINSGEMVFDVSAYSFTATVPGNNTTVTATFADAGYTLTTVAAGDGTVDPPAGEYRFQTGLVVPLTATPNAPAVFSHWENAAGDDLGADNPLDVTMNADETRTAVFVSPVNVTVVHTGPGTGTTVPSAGVQTLTPGDPITLTATPGPGSFFGGWNVDINSGEMVFDVSAYSFTATVPGNNTTVTATFADAGYTLKTAATGDGTVDPPAGEYRFQTGLVVPLTATPNGTALFDHWENLAGDNLGTDNPLDVTMNADETRTAVFKSSVNVTVAHAGAGAGTTVPAVGVYPLNVGDPVTFTATPDPGNFFGGWFVDVSGVDAFNVNSYSFTSTVPAADIMATATFDISGFTLETSVSGDGTIDPPAGTYAYSAGLVVPLTAIPGGASRFDHWENLAGDILGTDNPLDVTMDADATRVAVFLSPITLTMASAGAGTGTTTPPAGTSQVYPGDPITLTAAPGPGSFFGGWNVNIGGGGFVFDVPLYSFSSSVPDADTTATATFADAGFTLTTGVTGDGTVNPPAGTYAFAAGLEVPLTATPTGTAPFSHWEDGAGNRLPDGSDTTVVVDADVTRIAVFGYNLTMIKAGAGDGTTTPASAVSPGTVHSYTGGEALLTAIPSPTAIFTGWSGDLPAGVNATATIITVPMDQDRSITATFDPADFTLTVAQTGTGNLLPAPGAYGYRSGTVQTLQAGLIAGSGYAFSGWTGDITGDPAALVQQVTMDANRSVTANFTNVDTISLSVLTDGPGTTQPAAGVYSYLAGQQFSFEALPDPGKFFAGWTAKVEQGGVLVDAGMTFITPILNETLLANGELTAHFADVGHTITVVAPEGNGTLVYPPIGAYALADGTVFTLSASPEAGWDFAGWKDGTGTIVSTDTDFQVTVSADQSYQPIFVLPGFTLTMISAGTGSGTTTPASSPSPGTAHNVVAGLQQQLTATPAADSVFAGWSGDLPGGVNPQDKVIWVSMDQARTITATFSPADFFLTVQVSGTANPVNVTPAPGTYGYLTGQRVDLAALPAAGSPASFQAWTGAVTTGSFFAQLVMDGNKTVTANFTDVTSQTKVLTVNAPSGTGSGTTFPLEPGIYRIATNVALSFGANPNPGSYFGGWLDDYAGVNTPQGLSVIMDQDRAISAAFTPSGSLVTVILEGEGDIFPGPGTYALADGLQVPFRAERINSTWVFDSWRDGDDTPRSSATTYTLTVNGALPTTTLKGVFLEDTQAPVITACAPDTTLEPDAGCEWILPDYRGLVTATDNYPPALLEQDPLAGTAITAVTTVTIYAYDLSTASPDDTCTFTVTPVDTLRLCSAPAYNVDQNGNQVIDLTELMRVIQFYNSPSSAYHCSPVPGDTEDGFVPGLNAALNGCAPSAADLNGDFVVTLNEVLRVIQLFNAGSYWFCGSQSPDGDGVCAGQPARVRLVHAVQSGPSVNLCVDGNADASAIVYSQATPYLDASEASHDFGAILTGGNCATPLDSATVGLFGGDKETLILGGPSATPSLFPFADDLTVPAAGKAHIRFIHLNPTLASPVDLVKTSGGTVMWFNDVAYGTSGGYIEVDAGAYTLSVTNAAGNSTLVSGITRTLADGDVVTLVGAGNGAGSFNALFFAE